MTMKQNYYYEPTPRWIRMKFGGELIADSRNAFLVWEGGGPRLHYYFPPEDVRRDVLQETGRSGNGRQTWHVKVGEKVAENAAWSYQEVHEGLEGIEGYVAFRWNKMDHWYEEEEEVFVHPRDPYHRVDTMPSSRHIRVEIDGVTVAETVRPFLLFETGLPTRYYIPPEDVRMDLLEATGSHTQCPYKGTASYWSAKINGQTYKDIVWSYPDPIPESPKIEGLLSFYNERVDITVDGGLEARPDSPFA